MADAPCVSSRRRCCWPRSLLGVEALAALVSAAIALTQIRISRAEVGAGVAIWMLGYGVLLLALARGVFLGRRWSRAPSVATQLILLPIAFSFRGQPTTWVAGAHRRGRRRGTLVGLLHPRSTEVFVGPPAQPPKPGPRRCRGSAWLPLQGLGQLRVVRRLRLGLGLDPAEEGPGPLLLAG